MQKIKAICKTEKGAISVFLLLIFLGMLMLAGLIVDIGRIMVAERKVQAALDTAARSVLADYHEELVGQYGLYGISYSPEKEEALKRYFLVNLVERHPSFHFVNFALEDVKISGEVKQGLLNDEVFKQQIIEYMKYKGPVMMTENVVDLFLKGAFGKKADLLHNAKSTGPSLEDVFNSREGLNRAIKNAAQNTLEKAKEKFARKAVDELFTVNRLEENHKELQAAITKYENQLQSNNQQIGEIEAEIKQLTENEETTGIMTQGGQFLPPPELKEFKYQLNKQLEVLRENRSLLLQIQYYEQKADKSQEEYFRYLVEGKREEARACSLERAQFLEIIDGLYEQLQPVKELPDLKIADALPAPVKKEEKAEKNALLAQLEKFSGQKIAPDNPVTQLIQPEDFLFANERGKEVNDADGREETAQQMGMFAYDEQMSKWSEEEVDRIEGNIFTYVKKLTDALKRIAQGGVEKTYLVEYIMDKHTFVTSPVARGHFFSKGEVEYILFGSEGERSNLLQAFASIWGLRFAVNAVDSFFTNPAPTLLSRIGTAMVRGFVNATKDMALMYAGKGAPLCASFAGTSTRLSYSDHLRLLLLMKSEKGQLDRIRQLIQINLRQTKKDFVLKDYGTVFTATTETSIDLWFSSLLQLERFGLERFKGNKYFIQKTAVVGY